jgi:catechol 2,3-dioxygenase-like lactoylglutathione lyase family enzyme
MKTRFGLWASVWLLLGGWLAAAPEVGPICVTVSDMDRSLAFYTQVLDFKKVGDREFHDPGRDRLAGLFGARVREVDLRLGAETLRLAEYLNYPGRPVPVDSRSNDRWFQHVAVVVSDMDRAYARLRKSGAKPSSVEPQRLPDWNPHAGGIRAFYFRDPDNHNLEIIWFPPGKGDPRWQKKGGPLFQGIDHTAIVVRDTGESLKFYRDQLGLRVAGESRNSGIEQAYLNRVEGARLRITGLRGVAGPGIEFLEYLNPRDGRPMPADSGTNDLWHWEIHLREKGAGSPRRLRDPDGHVLVCEEEP